MLPVEKNKNYIMDITGMNHEGQGVGRINELVVFTDGAIKGEKAEVKIIKVSKAYAVGKLIKIINRSPGRAQPFCPAFDKCGGCVLQHMDYETQLEYKTGQVRDAIKRIAKLENIRVNDTIGMENPLNYRNKAQYPVGRTDKDITIGFYSARTHNIIEMSDCGIQDRISDSVKKIIREFMVANNIKAYEELSGKGLVRHVMTRVGFNTSEIMVVLVLNGSKLPEQNKLVRLLTEKVQGIKSIVINVNTEKTNIILGSKNICIFGKEYITDTIGGYKFRISPLSFFQVNPVQTEVLYGKVMEYAGLTGEQTVIDLYCGIGTITMFLAGKAKKVYGIEVVSEAIADARINAELNNVQNVEFIVGDAEKAITEIEANGVKADIVVVDPPRKGCDEKVLETIANMQPQKIIYVSCNPSTLARDLAILSEKGYKTVEIQPVDMLPHTSHIESVVRLEQAK
jgi:23S rRNA (uracil1939-C5)-methyltransferase